MQGRRDECGEQQEADEMGVGSPDEVGHERKWNELEESQRGRVPSDWDAVFMWGHKGSECPRIAPC